MLLLLLLCLALTGRAPQVKVMTTGLDLNLRQLAAVEHKYLTYDVSLTDSFETICSQF